MRGEEGKERLFDSRQRGLNSVSFANNFFLVKVSRCHWRTDFHFSHKAKLPGVPTAAGETQTAPRPPLVPL